MEKLPTNVIKFIPPLFFKYKNYKGIIKNYYVQPERVWFGSTSYHPENQYLLTAWDLEDNQIKKDFAVKDIISFGSYPSGGLKEPFILAPTIRIHSLKVTQDLYYQLYVENKTSELRKHDRNFKINDFLFLAEYDHINDKLTGEYLIRRISHIIQEGEWLVPGYCSLSLKTFTLTNFYGFYLSENKKEYENSLVNKTVKQLDSSAFKHIVDFYKTLFKTLFN